MQISAIITFFFLFQYTLISQVIVLFRSPVEKSENFHIFSGVASSVLPVKQVGHSFKDAMEAATFQEDTRQLASTSLVPNDAVLTVCPFLAIHISRRHLLFRYPGNCEIVGPR